MRLENRFYVKTSCGNSGYHIDGRVHAVIIIYLAANSGYHIDGRVHAVIISYLPAAGGNVGGMHWQVSEIKELLCYFKLAQLYI
jgi:hypothetical protein